MADDSQLASHVARLFHDRAMTRVEIAHRLGISRFRVARLLDDARRQGLVRVELRDIPAHDRDLARDLEEAWGLDMCVVASGRDADGGVAQVARLAASVLAGVVGPDEVIGIAWGSTVAATVDELPALRLPGVRVVQLAGSASRVVETHDPGEVARRLADRLGGTCHPLYAPAFVASRATRDALMREAAIRATTDLFDAVTLAVVGIGSLEASAEASALLRGGLLDAADVARLRAAGAVGDLLVHPYDAVGRFVPDPLAERAIAATPDQLRRIPRVLGVAGGVGKATAIAGALATGIVRILVTDAAAAGALSEMAHPGRPAEGADVTPRPGTAR